MFRERDNTVRIIWSGDHGPKIEWNRKISEITPGSSVGLETDEGDFVKITVTKNDAGNFVGSVVDIRPEPPRSERIADLGVGAEVRFGETNLKWVFSLPKQSIG